MKVIRAKAPTRASYAPRVILLLAAGILTLGVGCSDIGIDEYLATAREDAQAGRAPAAIISLKNVLREVPQHVEARYLLAQQYIAMGYAESAVKELERIRDQKSTDPAYQRLLMLALTQSGKFSDAVEAAQDLPQGARNVSVQALLAETHIGLDDLPSAEEALVRAEAIDPNNSDVLLAKGIIAFAKEDFGEAATLAQRAQLAAPDDPRAYVVEGRIQLPKGDAVAAQHAFEQAVRLVPARADSRVGVIYAMLAQRQYPAAYELAANLTRMYPNATLPLLLRASAAGRTGRMDEARDGLREVLSRNPENLLARFLLAQLLFDDGNFEQAEEYASTVALDAPDSEGAREFYAKVLIRNGKSDAAIALIESAVRGAEPQSEDLELLGTAYMRAGRAHEALGALTQAAGADPDSTPIRQKIVLAKLASNDLDAALSDVEALLHNDEDAEEAQVLRLLVDVTRQDFDKVLADATPMLEKSADNSLLQFIVGQAYLGKESFESAKKHLETALALNPKMASAMIYLALIESRANNRDGEIVWLERAREIDPNNLKVLLPLAQAKAAQGDLQGAVAHLETARAAHPRVQLPIITLARLYIASRDFPRALVAAREAAALGADNADVLLPLGLAELGTGDPKRALETLRKAAALAPESANVHFGVAAALHRLGHTDDAREALNQALAAQENHLEGLRTLAELEAAGGYTDRALEIAERMKSLFPDSVEGFVITGDIQAAAGKNDAALAAYEQALAKGADSSVVLRRYKLLYRQEKKDLALTKTVDWVTAHPDDARGHFILATAYHAAGQLPAAISEYEKTLKIDAQHVGAMNNLAWLYHETGDSRAESLAEKVYAIAPHDPGAADTLGWIVLNRGDAVRGEELLRKALDALPQSSTIRFHLAVAKLRNGDPRAAAELLEVALKVPEFEGRGEAEQLFARIGSR